MIEQYGADTTGYSSFHTLHIYLQHPPCIMWARIVTVSTHLFEIDIQTAYLCIREHESHKYTVYIAKGRELECPIPANSVHGMGNRCRWLNHDPTFTRSCVSYNSAGVAVVAQGQITLQRFVVVWIYAEVQVIHTYYKRGLLHGQWYLTVLFLKITYLF